MMMWRNGIPAKMDGFVMGKSVTKLEILIFLVRTRTEVIYIHLVSS